MALNLPNLLTLLRIAVIPIVVVAFFSDSLVGRWVAVITFFIACVSDFFDGYLARLLSQTSPLGQMLDPIADKLLVISTLFLLAAFGKLKGMLLVPSLIIICREIFISGVREYLATQSAQIPVSQLAKWKTTLQMFALGLLLTPELPHLGLLATRIGELCLWAAAAVTFVSGLDYFVRLIRDNSKAKKF